MNRRVVKGVVIGAGALVVALGSGALWVLETEAGARFAAARAQGLLSPRLAIGAVQGTIAGPLRVHNLRWQDPATGVDVAVTRAEVNLSLRALLGGTLHVRKLDVAGLLVQLQPTAEPPVQEPRGKPLDPPIDIVIDGLSLRDARVVSAGVEQVNVQRATLAGEWTSAALVVRQLDVQATQGEIHFAGTAGAKTASGDREVYHGNGTGRFSWQVGELRFVGTLEAKADDALADLQLAITEPLLARATLSLEQQDRLPWKYTVQVPEFDPRRGLLPESSLYRLAANLEGNGTLDEASARGQIVLNDTSLDIRSLLARRAGEDVALDGDIGFGGGDVKLTGTLRPQAEPLGGRVTLAWTNITIPADLAGQELSTAGSLDASGDLAAYSAEGAFRLGPPKRLADIRLRLTGTPEVVQLARFDVVQPRGRLAAAGVIGLQPQVTWTVAASATAFDPGAIFSDWPGRLDFRLGSTGAIESEGVRARVALQDLRGQLRGRNLAGVAELQLAADKSLNGKADVRSGASRVRVEAARDAAGVDQANATIEVASLGDWVPGGRGSLHGRIDASGSWPELAVKAELQANDLEYEDSTLRQAHLDLDITRPLQPAGTVTLDAQGASAAGFDFSTLRLRASGDQAQHQASLDAEGVRDGTRLSVGLDVAGGFEAGSWTGSLSRLQIAAPEIARLALQAPVDIRASATSTSFSEACLADGEIRLCVQGESGPSPALHARYSLHAVPLRIAQAFVDLPVGVDGTVEGEGEVRRDGEGGFAGQARLRSARGRILEAALENEDPRELLAWQDLQLDAAFDGDNARLSARAGLNDGGRLEARGTAAALLGTEPQVDGSATVQLPGIGVVEAFVPQLLNVQGSLAIEARVVGAMAAPRITGEARLSKLGFDLPTLGLKPRDGELVARADGDGPVKLEGSMHSGDGDLKFAGEAQLSGEAQLKLTGTNVLAADIPGVRVTLNPDLTVKRTAARTDIDGTVRIPSADVDLQRLPSAKRARSASPDVVVVDDTEAMAAAAQTSPVYARIELTLGDAVKLKGYGLDATVGGELDLRERPGEPTTASGELRVAGKYQAYGQDLTIQQGQLLFAGTPIDNPRLAITAVRQVDTVTAGFRVTGNARNPELSVFSDPAMGQANALSYLVAGKPLDQIGQGTGEGDALQSAARQLGTAAGGLLAKNVGKRLGVDELGIKESASIGGAALTVGQYLSPRLYLGYGVGLFQPGQVVTLRYRLSRELALEAEQGTLNSRAGIEFRKEK